ncbi:hypothetical protein Plhal703r1_c22g0094581 [Plasmopara halstedii]
MTILLYRWSSRSLKPSLRDEHSSKRVLIDADAPNNCSENATVVNIRAYAEAYTYPLGLPSAETLSVRLETS